MIAWVNRLFKETSGKFIMVIVGSLATLLVTQVGNFLKVPSEVVEINETLKEMEAEKQKDKTIQESRDQLQDQVLKFHTQEISSLKNAQQRDSIERKYIIQILNRIEYRQEKFFDGYYHRVK